MTSSPAATAAYRRAFAKAGVAEQVTFRRVFGQAPNTTRFDAVVNAVVRNYVPERSVLEVKREGAITQGDRLIIVIEADLAEKGFPVPLQKNDKAIVRGETLNIERVDPSKRGFAGATECIAGGV